MTCDRHKGFWRYVTFISSDSPHDAATQLQQPYWQEAPAGLSDQAPAASVAATPAACDFVQTTLEAKTDFSATKAWVQLILDV